MNMPVVPIPPDFNNNEELNTASTITYVDYLVSNNATTVMTTAGTSLFGLLTTPEIHRLNEAIASTSAGKKILGIPASSQKNAKEFARHATESYVDNSCYLMPIYPDRWYDDETIISYFSEIRGRCSNPLYIHCMVMRSGKGGTWDYTSDILNTLYEQDIICGIKEENSSFKDAYNFVSSLDPSLDVIVAGGSMRRHQYLRSAGANTFLAGIGNIFPSVEQQYMRGEDIDECLSLESKLFKVFMAQGWHKALRAALGQRSLTCGSNRPPWPKSTQEEISEILDVLSIIEKEVKYDQ